MAILKNSITSGNSALAPEAKKAQRDPNNNDVYDIGQVFINTLTDDVWTLTSYTGGIPNWESTAGGAGLFSSISVNPGPIDLTGTTTITGDNDVAGVITLSENGGTSGSIVIESLQGTASDSILLHSVAGGIEVTTDGAAGDIAITSTLGRVTIDSGEDIAGAVQLNASGGVLSTILLENTAGTGSDSINLHSTLGGIEITTDGAADDIAITSTLGRITIDSGEDIGDAIAITASGGVSSTITLQSTNGTGADSILLDSTLGGIQVIAHAAAKDVQIQSLLGTVTLDAAENAASNVIIQSAGGVAATMDILNTTGTADSTIIADASIEISSTAGGIGIGAGKDYHITAVDTSTIAVTGAAQGIIIQASDGDVNITANNVTGNGSILLTANEGTATDITLDANNAVGSGILLTAGTGGINITATEVAANAINIDATGVGAGVTIAPAATVASVDIANITPTIARTVTISGGDVDTAVADILNLGTGGVNTDAGASKEVNVASDTNLLGTTTVNIASGTALTGTHSVNIGTGTGGGTKRIDMGNVDALTTITAYGTIALNTSTSTGTTAIGNALAGAVTVDTAAGISLDAATASNFTVTGAADLTLRSTGGAVIVSSSEAVADAIQLTATDVAGGVTSNRSITISTAGAGIILPGPVSIVSGTGSPDTAVTATQGSLYLRTDGSGVNDRMYINTNGVTTWTAVVTVA